MKLVVDNSIRAESPRYFHGKRVARTWIMVIDKKKAHVFNKTPAGLDLIADAQPDFDRQAGVDTEHFPRQVSAWLYTAHKQDLYDRLVLVAAPKMLGKIRSVLPQSISEKLAGQIAKDLTNMSVQDIKRNLSNVVYFNDNPSS
mgnify:CR=1 FL=1